MQSREMSRRQFLGLAGGAAAVLGLGLVGCGGSSTAATTTAATTAAAKVSGSITAVGSTALQPLVEAAAEQFMTENPDVSITVQGGGSGQGITQISQGAVQIGNSDVFAEEKLDDAAKAAELTDHKVAVVGMGPIAHPEVGCDNLTMDQLKGIFMGTITNWKEVGGADLAITVINRASGSGTRATFESNVLKGETVPDTFKPQEQDSSGTVAKMVAETPGSISYLAFSYFSKNFVALKVDGFDPTTANVESNQWTIWAYEHMYTAAKPDAATAAFMEFMLGDDVQGSLVEENGYIPTSGMKVERDAAGAVSNK